MSQTIVTPPLSHTVRRAVVRMWEEPESRSILIGIAGTILVHLLLLLIGPRLLRSDPTHTMRPAAATRQFNIELAPDLFKPPPKPKSPMKFVETNPDAPENVPDKTNNFAARNQQVAQEKPTPNGKNDRPALDGQKDIHSTQIVDGRLEKPLEQTPVPPAPETPTTVSKLMAPKEEQSPLPGMEKKIGDDADSYGSNVAKFAESPKNIPEKVDGMKNAPLIQGATAMQPMIDPHHPRPRPQVVKSIQTRPAIFEENKVGTENVGLIGVSAQFSHYGLYLQKMIDVIQVEWDRLNDESHIYPPSGSMVTVKFILNSEGKIARIISVDSRATDAAAHSCTSAITIPAPYGPWTDDMKAMLGEEQELTFDFYYQ